MLRVTGFDTGACELFLKLESCNPGGSIKDRIALAMVDAAEREGRLRPGGRIFEATAGARCWRRCCILLMLPALLIFALLPLSLPLFCWRRSNPHPPSTTNNITNKNTPKTKATPASRSRSSPRAAATA